ncbi:3-hydroxyacyl-CoA dehydrogenase NAD-binding domain-containing protein [Aliiglaciecola sp. 3_MG-2023]|uniref:3-hydroxyacyl-CoA dehydrogenase family protein n=1 Tax=Aliiglaciecola sp. 3_MG-2023 TaxID=3062644 RepID=UPI0026E35E1E|nr:3-hydroxyacyl-CoA dehydrogenase NAD-binding domain-containing protein [Aliiglaciecola sp. 3_MG-2023]MDO6695438.1 3-hydroxyacyl-CoA dehydrogenase NAD-binding domain-containing protein [Aliiglaciecola sp. 3_MG-2023]
MISQQLKNIKRVAVIGAGVMGQGIAQGFAQAGLKVDVYDISEDALGRCESGISRNLEQFQTHGLIAENKVEILKRINYTATEDVAKHLEYCDVVVEVLPELIDLKQQFFEKLDGLPENIILATNTSSMTVSDVGAKMTTQHRLIGLHYFNPAHIIPAVEVHKCSQTSQHTIDLTLALMKAIGKQPVLVRKEIPGFIINRLTGAMEREIDYLLEQGVVSPEDLDTAVKASYGFRLACLGPMEAEDMIGLDTAARASANIFPTLSKADLPSQQLIDKVERGELGLKSGEGWYQYDQGRGEKKVAVNNERLLRQLKLFIENN